MEKIKFSAKIKAPREKVWNVLWDDTTYRMWTSAFSEGSYAVSDWKEGSKVLFLSADGNGMYSTVVKSIPNEFISFKHLGEVKNGKEEPLNEETKKWSGSFENYTLKEAGEETELTIEMDIAEDYFDYFNKTFPKALEKIKELAEDVTIPANVSGEHVNQ